ncbi:helix-turn-helix transcriptional regulator [Glycomyces albus]
MANEKFLQRELARTLIKHREKRGLTKEEAVWFLGTSKDILNSYESGKLQYMEPAVVESWLRDYGAPQAVIDNAKAKAKWIRQGNPANWQESAPEGFAKFTEVEPLTKTIDIHEDAYVTGLLQTPGYAEAVLKTNPNLTDEQRRTALGFRMQRQSPVFERPGGPPQMRVILPEEALLTFRDTDIYQGQISHLVKMNQVEGIDIFITPIGKITAARSWSFRIMSFIDRNDPEVVYQENLFGALYQADKMEVDRCRRLFTDTLQVVLALEEWRESDAKQ